MDDIPSETQRAGWVYAYVKETVLCAVKLLSQLQDTRGTLGLGACIILYSNTCDKKSIDPVSPTLNVEH